MFEATTGVLEANASVRTIPKLSPPSEGAQSRSASPSSRHFSSSDTRPAISTPSGSSRSGATSSPVAPATVRRASTPASRKRLEGAQQHGQALAALGAADEQDVERAAGPPGIGAGRAQVHAVGDDAVAAAVEPARGPLRGLGHRDARAQLGVEAPRSPHVARRWCRPASWWSRCGTWPRSAAAPPPLRTSSRTARSARARGRCRSRRSGAPCRAWRPTRGRRRGSTPRRSPGGPPCGPAGSCSRARAAAPARRRGAGHEPGGRRGRGGRGGGPHGPGLTTRRPGPRRAARLHLDTCTNRAKRALHASRQLYR